MSNKLKSKQRRDFIQNCLVANGAIGLRSLLLGLPPQYLLRGDVTAANAAKKFLIFSERRLADPVNANIPGTYVEGIRHAKVSEAGDIAAGFETPVPFTLGSQSVVAASPWAGLPANIRQNLHFIHARSNTSSHNDSINVMGSFSSIKDLEGRGQELLPSAVAQETATGLGTLQVKPFTLSGFLSYNSVPEGKTSPLSLKNLLGDSSSSSTSIGALRDTLMDQVYASVKSGGTRAQKKFLDNFAISKSQAKTMSENLYTYLEDVSGNESEDQVKTAAALVLLKIAPVIRIEMRFGGDNHTDGTLIREVEETIEGVNAINTLWTKLTEYGVQDQAVFALSNVFGRTLETRYANAGVLKGRDHNQNHSAIILLGSSIRGGVSGGLDPAFNNLACTGINAQTGLSADADIIAGQTHISSMKTIMAACGVAEEKINERMLGGKIIRSCLAAS